MSLLRTVRSSSVKPANISFPTLSDHFSTSLLNLLPSGVNETVRRSTAHPFHQSVFVHYIQNFCHCGRFDIAEMSELPLRQIIVLPKSC